MERERETETERGREGRRSEKLRQREKATLYQHPIFCLPGHLMQHPPHGEP